MEIIKLSPAFKDYLWGGTKLRDVYGKECKLDKIAESWELSTHSAGESTVANGKYSGLSLSEYIEKMGKGILGANCEKFESFPVLIKLIDAKEPLSVQVHPSDEYALRVEKEYGKTEMWYVVDCDEGASLCFGVNQSISPQEFKQRIENNTVMEVMNQVKVNKGDVFFIEAGTIHAIGAGILICEIQQNSNTTYRVYDYDRRGADGKPRELHVEKALAVSDFNPSDTADGSGTQQTVPGGTKRSLAECKYFKCEKFTVDNKLSIVSDESSFVSLMFLTGEAGVQGPENSLQLKAGESLFVPAGTGEIFINGQCSFIKTTV